MIYCQDSLKINLENSLVAHNIYILIKFIERNKMKKYLVNKKRRKQRDKNTYVAPMKSRAFTEDEINELLLSDLADLRMKTYICISATTGFRVSEICSLTINDVAFIKGGKHVQIREYATIEKTDMKNKKHHRTVSLNKCRNYLKPYIESLLKEVKVYADGHKEYKYNINSPLFSAKKGRYQGKKPLSRGWLLTKIKELSLKTLGLTNHLSCHSFRKTFATMKYAATNSNILLLRKIMGHAYIETTERYVTEANILDTSNDTEYMPLVNQLC